MHPVLFKIPFVGLSIHSYGVMVALAFLVGMWFIAREAKIKGLNQANISDLFFYLVVAAIVGSRIMFIIISERQEFIHNPLIFFKIWNGGLVFYGGVIGTLIVSIWYSKKKNMQYSKVADCFTPALPLGHAIGRIGCFLAGCCYGRVLDHTTWYSTTFPISSNSFAPTGMPLYPTQLMECFGELIIFGLIMLVRRWRKFDGQLIATYLMLYAILRSFNEYFRGDVVRGFIIEPWLSTSQFVSIFLFIIGALIYAMYFMGKLKKD